MVGAASDVAGHTGQVRQEVAQGFGGQVRQEVAQAVVGAADVAGASRAKFIYKRVSSKQLVVSSKQLVVSS